MYAKGVPGAKTFLPYSHFVNDFKRKKLGFFPIIEAFTLKLTPDERLGKSLSPDQSTIGSRSKQIATESKSHTTSIIKVCKIYNKFDLVFMPSCMLVPILLIFYL